MKTISTSKTVIAASAAAVVSIAVFTSCNNDSPSAFNAAPEVMASALASAPASTMISLSDSTVVEVGTHHFGETITKYLQDYGETVFVCISTKSPYYFIHVSDRMYSAKEMDAMHYQQEPLAVDEKMLEAIADVAAKEWAPKLLGPTVTLSHGTVEWDSDVMKNYRKEFKKLFKENTYYSNKILHSSIKDFSQTHDYWIRNAEHEYPYGHLYLRVSATDGFSSGFRTTHHCHYIITDDHYLMFAFVEK